MMTIVVFHAAQIAVTGYVLWRGGAPERVAASLLQLAALLNLANAVLIDPSFRVPAWSIAMLDVGLLAGLCLLAAFADRYWPMWLASLQFMAVAVHGAVAWDRAIIPWVYWASSGKAAYVMLAVIVAGAARHRARELLVGREWNWTFQRRRADGMGPL